VARYQVGQVVGQSGVLFSVLYWFDGYFCVEWFARFLGLGLVLRLRLVFGQEFYGFLKSLVPFDPDGGECYGDQVGVLFVLVKGDRGPYSKYHLLTEYPRSP
jgi:hypothetical protein